MSCWIIRRKPEPPHEPLPWKRLLLAIAIVVAILWLTGCIPVRIVPTDEPILVAPVGVEQPQADGSILLNPELPQPEAEDYKPPQTFPWGDVLMALASLFLGGTGVGAVAIPMMGKLRTALSITAQLADANAAANTDAEVAANKRSAAQAQEAAGVRKLIQRTRGKA